MNGMSHSIAKPQTKFNGMSQVSLRAKTHLNEESPPATTVPTSPPSSSVETQKSKLKPNAEIQCDTGTEAVLDSKGTASKNKLSKPSSAKVKMFIKSEKHIAAADAPPGASSLVELEPPVIDKALDPSASDTVDEKESIKEGESQSQVIDIESHLKNQYSVKSLDATAPKARAEARTIKLPSKGGGSSMESQSETVKPPETLDVKCRNEQSGIIKKETLSKKPNPPAVMLHEVKSPSDYPKTLVGNKFLPLKIKSSANDKSLKPYPHDVNTLADVRKPSSSKPETAVKNKFLPLVKTKSSTNPARLKQDSKAEAGFNITDESSKAKNATQEHGAEDMLHKADRPTVNRENDKPGTPTGDSSVQAKHTSLHSRSETSPKKSTPVTVSAKPSPDFSKAESPSLSAKKASTAKAQTCEANPKAAHDKKTLTLNNTSGVVKAEKEAVSKKKDVTSESSPVSTKSPAVESKPIGSNVKSAPSESKVKEKSRSMHALQVDLVSDVNSALMKPKVAGVGSDERLESAEIENAKKDPPTGASVSKTENPTEKTVVVTNGKPTKAGADSSATEVKADVAPKKQDSSVDSRSESKRRAVMEAKTTSVAEKQQPSPETSPNPELFSSKLEIAVNNKSATGGTKETASKKPDPAAKEKTETTLAKAKMAAGCKFLELDDDKSLSPVEIETEKQDPSKTKRSTNPWVSSTVNGNGGLSETPKACTHNTQSKTATGTNLDVRGKIEVVKGKSRNIQVTEAAPLEEITPGSKPKSKPESLMYFLDVVEPTRSEASFTAVASTASPGLQLEEATVAALTKKPWWKKYASSNDSLEETAIALLEDFVIWSFIETPKLIVSAALWVKDLSSSREGEPPEGK
jgi:hypothetical protein